MTTIHLTAEQVAKMDSKTAAQVRPALVLAARIAASRSLLLIQSRTRSASPASEHGSQGAFDTGSFLRSWKTGPDPRGAVLYNGQKYAGVIELGRRAGARPPPFDTIAKWLLRKIPSLARIRRTSKGRFISRLNTVMPIARRVAVAIARRGLRGRFIVMGAMETMSKYLLDEVVSMLTAVEEGRFKSSAPKSAPRGKLASSKPSKGK